MASGDDDRPESVDAEPASSWKINVTPQTEPDSAVSGEDEPNAGEPPRQDGEVPNSSRKRKSLAAAYPLVVNHTHSAEYLSIPQAVGELGDLIFYEGWAQKNDFHYFNCIYRRGKGRYYRFVESRSEKRGKPRKIRVLPPGQRRREIKRGRKYFKEIRSHFHRGIDAGRFTVFLHTPDEGLFEIKDKDFILKFIDPILASGRWRKLGSPEGAKYDIVLIEAHAFRNWASNNADFFVQIEAGDLSGVGEICKQHKMKYKTTIRQKDIKVLMCILRGNRFRFTKKDFEEIVWTAAQKQEPISGRDRTNDGDAEKIKNLLPELVGEILIYLGADLDPEKVRAQIEKCQAELAC